MNTLVDASGHLGDDQLLALIDGTDHEDSARWADHIAQCTDCARDADSLRADSAMFSSAVQRADDGEELSYVAFEQIARPRVVPIQSAQRRRGYWQASPAWLRAAAVLLLVAAPVAAIPALRELLFGTNVRDGSTDVRPTSAPPQITETASSTIRFVPTTAEFIVRFDASQNAGALRLTRAAGTEAVFDMENATDVVPVTAENILRIRNQASTAVTYALQVPAAVRTVSVRVGDTIIATIDAATIDAGATVTLRR